MRLGRVLALTTVVATVTAGTAGAQTEPQELLLHHPGGTDVATVVVTDVYPGLVVTQSYDVGLSATAPAASLTLRLVDLTDHEQGCNDPEIEAGDTTCGGLEGELSEHLLLSAALTPAGDCATDGTTVLPPIPVATAVRTGPLDLVTTLEPGEHRCLQLTLDLPWAVGNLVQSDAATFDIEVHASEAEPPPQVLGVVLERPPTAVTDTGASLALAGIPVARWLALSVALLATGGTALALGRRRPDA